MVATVLVLAPHRPTARAVLGLWQEMEEVPMTQDDDKWKFTVRGQEFSMQMPDGKGKLEVHLILDQWPPDSIRLTFETGEDMHSAPYVLAPPKP